RHKTVPTLSTYGPQSVPMRRVVKGCFINCFLFRNPFALPITLGGSRTYICDYAPSVELTSSDFASILYLPHVQSRRNFPCSWKGRTQDPRAGHKISLHRLSIK
nr:hypothetical protein [Tanacetum cinerariifolium]